MDRAMAEANVEVLVKLGFEDIHAINVVAKLKKLAELLAHLPLTEEAAKRIMLFES